VTISIFAFALIVMIAATVAFATAQVLRRLGVVTSNPVRYLPHFVLLLIVVIAPMISSWPPARTRVIAVLSGMVLVWLAAVSASEYTNRKS
jgi:hypothetical protein